MVADGHDVFAVNGLDGGSVTELNASSGALVRVISGSPYQIKGPDAVAVSGERLFVANLAGNSVTELSAATGALVRVVSGPAYQFSDPVAVAAVGGDAFVANSGIGSLTEFDGSTGRLVQVISCGHPMNAMVANRHNLFIASGGSNSVFQVNLSRGDLVHSLSAPFSFPDALALDGLTCLSRATATATG